MKWLLAIPKMFWYVIYSWGYGIWEATTKFNDLSNKLMDDLFRT